MIIRLKWEESRTTKEERNFRQLVEQGLLPSPLNKIRLFKEKQSEDDIRESFCRNSASWR